MSTNEKYNFWKLIKESKIAIPKFQRDYAQGRKDVKSEEIRKEFVKNLFQSLNDANYKIQLDFVYGAIQNDCFEPLDGQQRLTTLYLLHLYIATREGRLNNENDEVKDLFKKFSYETRQSSTDFCQELVKGWTIDKIPSKSIKDQTWYSNMWNQDSTIQGMLTMLDAIHEEYNKSQSNQLWDKLINNQEKITFYKLNLEEFGLSDELYIKMNARGKPLTDFENLKAQLLHFFSYGAEGNKSIIEDKEHEAISEKFDQSWTDFFWAYVKDLPETDDKGKELDKRFKNFLDFITNILYTLSKDGKESIDIGNFNQYKLVYSNKDNIQFVFGANGLLDKFSVLKKEGLKDLFENQIFTDQRQDHNQKIFIQRKTSHNLLEVVFETGKQDSGGDLLLYAILYQIYKTELNNTNTINNIDHLCQRLRILRNIIWNSTINSNEKNHLEFVQNLMIEDIAKVLEKSNFDQSKEELQKFINEAQLDANLIFELENHPILMGTVKLFLDKDDKKYITKEYIGIFYSWFENKNFGDELNTLRQALLACQKYNNPNETFSLYSGKSTSLDQHRYSFCANEKEWRKSFFYKDEKDEKIEKCECYFKLLDLMIDNRSLEKISNDFSDENNCFYPIIKNSDILVYMLDKCYTFNWNSKPPEIGYVLRKTNYNDVSYKPIEFFDIGSRYKGKYDNEEEAYCLTICDTLCYLYYNHSKYSLWFHTDDWQKNKLENISKELNTIKLELKYDGDEWRYIDNLESADILTVLDIIKDV